MIRPSALQFAETCAYAAKLAEMYPETGEAAENGKVVHAEIARALLTGDVAQLPEAHAAVTWYLTTLGDVDSQSVFVEKHVGLIDDLTVLTEGTPDLVVRDSVVTVVDWKTGRPENVTEPDDNLQLIAYGLAVSDGAPFRCALVFLDGDTADARWSRVFEPSEHVALLSRVRAAATREQVPAPGDHCETCRRRWYCPAWKARVSVALATTAEASPSALTPQTAATLASLIDRAEDWIKVAKATFKEYVRGGGECVVNGKRASISECAGRATADVEALRADGMDKYIKQGASYDRITWRKVTNGKSQ